MKYANKWEEFLVTKGTVCIARVKVTKFNQSCKLQVECDYFSFENIQYRVFEGADHDSDNGFSADVC